MEGIERVCKFLDEAQTYYLATAEGDQPRVRPFGTALLYGGKLYIETGKVKNVSRQLAANPKAEICAFRDGKWLRVAGELVNEVDLISKEDIEVGWFPSYIGISNRSSMIAFNDTAEIADINFIQSKRVNMKPVKTLLGNLRRNYTVIPHLREVTDSSKQTVCDTRCSPASAGDFIHRRFFNLDSEYTGCPADDGRKLIVRVVFQF